MVVAGKIFAKQEVVLEVAEEIFIAEEGLVAEEEILVVEEMKDQRIRNKI